MLITIVVVTTLALWVLRQNMQRSVSDAQEALIDSTASNLDEEIAVRKEALSLNAAILSHVPLSSRDALEEHFATRPTFTNLFDALFVADHSGRVIFDAPQLPGRRGSSLLDRDYFKTVITAGQFVISKPLSGKSSNLPNVVFATPIRTPAGEIVGMVGGILFLTKPNFLSKLGDARIGKQGYFSLITQGETPTIVMHAKSDRILERIALEQAGTHLKNALQGYEGTVEDTGRRGVEALFSYRSLRSAPWVLTSVYPTSEAYASMRRMQALILALGLAVAVIAAGALWWFADRLLAPLGKLQEAMHASKGTNEIVVAPGALESRELAEVIHAYNDLMADKRQSEQRVRDILTHASDAFISIDADGLVTEWNRQAEETFGWQRGEALGKDLAELLIPEATRAAHWEGISRFATSGRGPSINKRLEVRALCRDGAEIEVELSIAAARFGERFSANAFLRDIGDRKAAERKLADSEKRLRTITDNLPALISYVDKEQRYRFANATYEEWFGIASSRLIGQRVADVFGPDGYDARREFIERALNGESVSFEMELDGVGGSRHVKTNYIPDRSQDGSVIGMYTLSADISALKAVEAQLALLAGSDALTGLPNRRRFDEKLDEAMARCRRLGKPMALLFLDVDHFKAINDTLGHGVGDEVLKEFAKRLKAGVRATDTVARLAGDEFVAVLEGLQGAERAEYVARKMVAAVNTPFDLNGIRLTVSTSIGVAFYQGEPIGSATLVEIADKALYLAKQEGRNTFRLLPSTAEHTSPT